MVVLVKIGPILVTQVIYSAKCFIMGHIFIKLARNDVELENFIFT